MRACESRQPPAGLIFEGTCKNSKIVTINEEQSAGIALYSSMEQMNFFGGAEALEALSRRGDPLQKLEQTIDFEAFRAELERALYKPVKGPGGAPRGDAVLMFKLLCDPTPRSKSGGHSGIGRAQIEKISQFCAAQKFAVRKCYLWAEKFKKKMRPKYMPCKACAAMRSQQRQPRRTPEAFFFVFYRMSL
jgi:hypothetical protein